MSEPKLLDGALDALETTTGLHGRPQGDAVELSWRGRAHRFRIEQRAFVRPSHLPLLREQIAHNDASAPILLVTRHVGPPLADKLREGGVPFVDASGNAWIETDDWMVLVTGRGSADKPPRSAVSRSMWQVAYILLRGGADTATVRELAELAGTSHGTAANALSAFERRGWIARYEGKHPVEDPDGLLRAWEFGYVDRLRASLDLGCAVAPGAGSLQAWEEAVRAHFGPERGLLGGELAAERTGTDIVAATATLHVPRWDAETMRALSVLPAKDGPIAVRSLFGTCNHAPDEPGLADPLLIRAELLAIDDDRLDTTRAELRERIVVRWPT